VKNKISQFIVMGVFSMMVWSPAWSDASTNMSVEQYITLEMQVLRAKVALVESGSSAQTSTSSNNIYSQAGTTDSEQDSFKYSNEEAIEIWYEQNPQVAAEREMLVDTLISLSATH